MRRDEELIKNIISLRDYWLNIHKDNAKEAVDGFIHSLLVMFDGDSGVNDCHMILLTDLTDNVVINPVAPLHEKFHEMNQ